MYLSIVSRYRLATDKFNQVLIIYSRCTGAQLDNGILSVSGGLEYALGEKIAHSNDASLVGLLGYVCCVHMPCAICSIIHQYFFLSLYASYPEGAFGYEADHAQSTDLHSTEIHICWLTLHIVYHPLYMSPRTRY